MDPRHAPPRVSCCTQRWTSTVASIVNLNKLRPWGNDAVAWRKRQCKEQCQVHAGEEDHALWHVSSCIAARLVSYCYIQSSLLDCSSVSMFRSDIHRRNHVWQIIGLDLVWTVDPPFFSSSILPLLLPLIHVPPIPHPYSPRVQRINNSESQKGVVRWPCGLRAGLRRRRAWVQVAAASPRRCLVTVLRKLSHPSCLCSPSSETGSSPLKGCEGNCGPGGK